MAEQLVARLPLATTQTLPAPETRAAPARISPHAALRHAKSCLDAADRKLRKGQSTPADEVIGLLRTAASHLTLALERRHADE